MAQGLDEVRGEADALRAMAEAWEAQLALLHEASEQRAAALRANHQVRDGDGIHQCLGFQGFAGGPWMAT